MIKLDKRKLKAMTPDEIIDIGLVYDSPDPSVGINIAGTGNRIKWVAVRGGIADWAIYTENPHEPGLTFEEVRRFGDKLHNDEHIRQLVDCTDGALKAYRH